MKHSEAKRAATRAKSVEQQEQNKNLLDMLRDEMAEEMDEDVEPTPSQGYATEEKEDYYENYASPVLKSPMDNRDDRTIIGEGHSMASKVSRTDESAKTVSSRPGITMSFTPRSISSPLQRGSSAGPRKSVLKGGDYWKAQKEKGDGGGDGSKLYVKSQEQMERERIDPQEFEELKRQVERLTEERDSLLKDKDTWLVRVKQDNIKLAGMLKHVKGLKTELVKSVDEVMTEKMALRSMKAEYLGVSLEEYLLGDDCAVSESRRRFFPQAKKEAAQVFCDRLMKLAAGCRQNQTEVLEYVKDLVQEAEGAFIKGDQMTTELKLEALKNIASTEPGNVVSAKAIAESLSEGVVGAMTNRAAEALAHRAAHLADYDSTATDARLAAKDEEVQALTTQNENLKANVSQMRKKYQQLMEQATKKSANSAAEARKKDHLFLDEAKDRHHAGKRAGAGARMSVFHQDTDHGHPHMVGGHMHPHSGRRSVASESQAGGGGGVVHLQMPKVDAEDLKLTAAFDRLPFDIRKQANDMLTKYVTTVVSAHPLSNDLRPIVIKETINEVATAMHGVVGLALVAFQTQGELDPDSTDRKTTKELLGRVMALPSLQHEVSTYTHMLLTYLFSRYSSASNVSASSNMTIKQAAALPGDTPMPPAGMDTYETAAAASMPGAGAGAGGNPFTGSSSAAASGVRFAGTATDTGDWGGTDTSAASANAGAMRGGGGGGGGGGGAIRFNKASMPKAKAAPRPVSKPGDPSAAKGTGEYGNVFFASGSAEEITLMTLEPTPREKPKTNPNLPSYMQPVPKKRDRR